MQDSSYKYWAFISYSHRDQAWAEWLHGALETYRVPRRLVGRDSAAGPLPRRLFPVFRDQEELPSSPNLSAAIDQALRQSRYLVVIASPYAAVSKWVDQEIACFRALGRGDRILCLIADGEPHADLQPGRGFLECFPPALRSIEGIEPIGADVRPGKDGKAAAKLKLIAGLLGVGLDELRRRERRRRVLQRASWLAAGLAAVALLAGVWTAQQREKQRALARQALQAHVRTMYEKGRQELLAHNQARAAVYLNEAYRLGVDTPALRFMLARAMRIVEAQRQAFQTGSAVKMIRFSPDSKLLITTGNDDIGRVWSLADTRKLFEITIPRYARATELRFSRDSRRVYHFAVADGASGGQFTVWDVATGRQMISLETPPALNHAFNPFDQGSRRAASIDPQRDAEIVDLQTGQVLRTLRGPYSVAGFSRDGLRLLTGADSGEVGMWDGEGLHRLRALRGLGNRVHEIDDTEDGKLVGASARDGSIRVWRASDGQSQMVAGHPSPNPWLVFNMDGTRLLSGADDGARVWNTGSGQLAYVRQSMGAAGTSFDIASYARWLMESGSGRLAVQDIQSGIELYTLDAHEGEPLARDISEDDRLIATGGADGRVVLWNVPNIPDVELRHAVDAIRWAESRPPPAAVAFNHSGSLLATGAGDGMVKLWDATTHKLLRSMPADSASIGAIAFSDDDTRLATGGYSDGVKLWDPQTGALLRRFDSGGRPVLSVLLSRGNSAVAAAVQGGLTLLWAMQDGELLASFNRDQARAAAFNPDGTALAIGMQQQVKLWVLAQRRFVWSAAPKTKAGIADLTFSRDGSKLLMATSGREAALLNAQDGSMLGDFDSATADNFSCADFSGDGQTAVLGEQNGGAMLWQPSTGQRRSIEGHVGGTRTVAFSPDGRFVLTSGADATAKLWNAGTGELLDTIANQPGQMPIVPYRAATFSPDGRWVLTGSVDGDFRLSELREETRGSEQIAAILKCRVPWQLDGDGLRPVTPSACPD